MRFSLRLPSILVQHRAFSACVILSIGAGISCAAGVFAVVDSIRHGRLPFSNADRVEHVYASDPLHPDAPKMDVPPALALELGANGSPFAAIATYRRAAVRARHGDRDISAWGTYVSPGFAAVLGPRMLIGRPMIPDQTTPVVMFSHRFWSTTMGSDSSIVGQTLRIQDANYTVIGVAAPEWDFPEQTPMWVSEASPPPGFRPRPVGVLALRHATTTHAAARTFIERAGAALPDEPARRGARVSSMEFRQFLTRRMTGVIVILTIIAVFVGFITIVNFTGLLLARGIRRRGEIGVRAALGASVSRLARHIIGESLLLCAIGGVLAAFLAPQFVNLLRQGMGNGFPGWLEITLGWRTVVASVSLCVIAGAVFGLGPALDIARPALGVFLRSAGHAVSSGAGLARTRAIVVSIQVALATGILVLLGGVFGRTLILTKLDPGYDYGSLIIGRVESDSLPVVNAVAWNVRQVAGVADVAVLHWEFLSGDDVHASSGTAAENGVERVIWLQSDDSFYSVVRPVLVAGRMPTADEQHRRAAVAVVSREFARRVLDNDAVGKTLYRGTTAYTVIGVVDKLERSAVQEQPTSAVFTPMSDTREPWSATEVWVRVANPAQLFAPLRRLQQLASTDRLGAPVYNVRALSTDLHRQMRSFRAVARVCLLIYGIALGLAALGIYGLVAYTAEMRNREMAIREAVGASRAHVAGLLMRNTALQSLAGIVGGSLLATVGASFLSRFDVVLKSTAGMTTLSLVIVGVVMLLASLGPLRATWHRDLSAVLRD